MIPIENKTVCPIFALPKGFQRAQQVSHFCRTPAKDR